MIMVTGVMAGSENLDDDFYDQDNDNEIMTMMTDVITIKGPAGTREPGR